jgi:hypothetical protein
MGRTIPNVPKHERFNESRAQAAQAAQAGQGLYEDLKKIEEKKNDVRNDSGIVCEIMTFSSYEKYADYTRGFDWSKSDFIKTLMLVVIEKLLETPTQNDFFIQLEENVELHFGVNLSMQSIVMKYMDKRFCSIVKFKTPKEKQPIHYDPFTLSPTQVEFDDHTFYNRPISHHVLLRKKTNDKREEFVDVEETLSHLIDEFVVFSNVIDIEHEGVLWVAKKEEERKRDYSDRSLRDFKYPPPPPPKPLRPKPRTIID